MQVDWEPGPTEIVPNWAHTSYGRPWMSFLMLPLKTLGTHLLWPALGVFFNVVIKDISFVRYSVRLALGVIKRLPSLFLILLVSNLMFPTAILKIIHMYIVFTWQGMLGTSVIMSNLS